jgi:ankyrin repeat protein
VELLISKGANVNAGTYLPLYGAAKRGHKDIVELLIAKGAEVDKKDYRGYTALFTAAQWGWKDIAELLIAKGANVNTIGGDPRTPLYQAAEGNRIELVKLLIAKGANVNTENYLPLYGAAASGNKEMVELLIAKGANVNAKDWRGSTALLPAVEGGHKDVVEFLISKGASINVEDGLTPLFLAENKGYKEIVELLRVKGADVHIPSKMYLGSYGDETFLFGQWWRDPERFTPPISPIPGLAFGTSRWTAGDAGIRWPVTPRRQYRLQLACEVKPYVPGPKIIVNGQFVATIRETGWQFLDIIIPARIIGDDNFAQVEIKSQTWDPAKKEPPNRWSRNIGVQVTMFSLTESSANTPGK